MKKIQNSSKIEIKKQNRNEFKRQYTISIVKRITVFKQE